MAIGGCVAESSPDEPVAVTVEQPAPAPAAPDDFPEQGTAEWAALTQDEQVRACQSRDSMVGCMLTWGDCYSTTFAAVDDPLQVGGEKVIVPVDRGPREYAMGEAVLDSSGTPVAYVVASGDVPEFVADRFCTHLAYLHTINSVRRSGLAGTLYAGDTINLDATTIFSVGDQNGVVSAGSPPMPHPPQQ